MKKLLALVSVFALMLTVASAQENVASEDPGSIGLGYQGMIMGSALMNGASIRYQGQDSPFGFEFNLGQWSGDIERNRGENKLDIDVYALQLKGMYTLIKRQNTNFYAGVKGGWYNLDIEDDAEYAWQIAPLFGAEWRWSEMPEIGVNFEVSYDFCDTEVKGSDINLRGVMVTFGIHYYF
jgi:opacity protein-like surface antigen